MGSVALRNNHPFAHGRWLFAHNGTIAGFMGIRDRLLERIAPSLGPAIGGDTDSEHAFFLLLTHLQRLAGDLDELIDIGAVRAALIETIRMLEELRPVQETERSEFNFLLTNGRLLAATRWGHPLHYLERRGAAPGNPEPPPDYRAVLVASEPTTPEPWQEVPDHALLLIGPALDPEILPIKL
jgi:glutamine amidotransferase